MSRKKHKKGYENFRWQRNWKDFRATHKHNDEFIFADPVTGIEFRGGSVHGAIIRDEVIVSAAGDPRSIKIHGFSNTNHISSYLNPFIDLMWEDGSGFEFFADFWQSLLAQLREEKRNVLCMCTGGHGRTGTMLAIFAALTGACEGQDPVQFIRKRYCNEAVETEEQKRYIQLITKIRVLARPSADDLWRWFDEREEKKDDGKLPSWSEV